MEYIDSDIDQMLKHKIKFSEVHLQKLVYNILCSLSFFHENNVVHRDFKSANILIQNNCNIKICDFGMARSLPESCMNY